MLYIYVCGRACSGLGEESRPALRLRETREFPEGNSRETEWSTKHPLVSLETSGNAKCWGPSGFPLGCRKPSERPTDERMSPVRSLPPTWDDRKTHTPPSTPPRTPQTWANDKCARRKGRKFLSGAPVHTRVWAPSCGAAPEARRGFLDFCGNRWAWFLNGKVS